MPFLNSTWYLAAWSKEVVAGQLLARTIAGEDLVFFRGADGAVAVLEDLCPHRFAPLSSGLVKDGALRCGYHGLAFDGSGACVHNPHGPIPRAARTRAYPAVERHACVWIWMGPSERADTGLIPNLDFIDIHPPEERVEGLLHTRAHYQLMVDNIMDLTHADYIHPALGGGINTRAKMTVAENGREVVVRWSADADQLAPAHDQHLPVPGELADFRNEVYWREPGVMRQRLQFGPTGQLAERGVDSWTMHTMTPETETSTHYFFCHTSDSLTQNPGIAPLIQAGLRQAFVEEDGPMLESQQRKIAGRDFWSLKPVLLSTDGAAVRARRVLDAMIEEERQDLALEPAE